MKTLQILGMGCLKCDRMAETAEAAVKALGIEVQIEKISDLDRILEFGVLMTPALAIDGKVKIFGKVPTVDEVKTLLSDPRPGSRRER